MRDRSSDPITLALRLLAKEVQSRLQKHPGAHLVHTRKETVELRIRIPTRRTRDG